MPVDPRCRSPQQLSQRQQYGKGGLGRWYWDFRDQAALAYIAPRDRCILDLGCGEGITLERLVTQFSGRDILGIDVMPENIAICLAHRLPARLGDLYELDLPNNSQDVVLFFEVIEHLQEPEKALAEIHRLLRPDGKVIIIIPNDLNMFLARLLTLKFQESFFDPGHLRQWTPKQIFRILLGLGFQVLASRNIPFYFWPFSLHGLVVGIKSN